MEKGFGFITNSNGSGGIFVGEADIHFAPGIGFKSLREREDVAFDLIWMDCGRESRQI